MPLSESTHEFDAPALQAIPASTGERLSSYPHLPLRPTGERQRLIVRTVELENRLTRVKICPDLGGRIVEWFDKRTGTAIVELPSVLPVDQAGRRGASSPTGIQWYAGNSDRANAMGPVDFQLHEGEQGDSTVILHELVVGEPIGVHVSLTLGADDAGLRVAMRLQSRTWDAYPAGLGWILPAFGEPLEGGSGYARYDADERRGISLSAEPGTFLPADGTRVAILDPAMHALGPMGCSAAECRLDPISDLPSLDALGAGVFLSLGESLEVQSSVPIERGTAYLQTATGEAFSSPLTLDPASKFRVNLVGGLANPQGVRIHDASGSETLCWPVRSAASAPRLGNQELFEIGALLRDPETAPLAALAKHPAAGYGVALARARRQIEARNWSAARDCLSTALEVGSDSVIPWWLFATVQRMADDEADNGPLLNAHFLSPFEPVLRAEAFLTQPQAMGAEPSALVAPVARDPEAVLDVACLLLELGWFDQAHRWIDECLRHAEVPMLRVLLAWAYRTHSRMESEAGEQLRRASSTGIQPPYPWRAMEIRAICELRQFLPDDPAIAAWSSLLEDHGVV